MSIEETLLRFERKYMFLYEIEVNGFPVYTCFRDRVNLLLSGDETEKKVEYENEKGRVYPKRILDSFLKLKKFKKAKTLIFTSTMFRRDYGRNLAAEYLMEKYPESVAFEWPSRTDAYDIAYFQDPKKDRYCPIDFYVLVYKIYSYIHRKEESILEGKCRQRLIDYFSKESIVEDTAEKRVIQMLIQEMPKSYASTAISQQLFRKLFRKYKSIEYAIDFWGSGRENIIPVLPGKFEAIELQHGIIMEFHPGYIYPTKANEKCKRFFARTLLLYGEATKKLLIQKSVFTEEQIEVIGNPRILKYKQEFGESSEKRQYILFTSQPFEQDVKGAEYYSEMIPILQSIQKQLNTDEKWKKYSLAIKLHPRENNGIKNKYEENIPECKVFDNATQLYELLGKSFLHITATSTTLYEAALFDTPTVLVPYQGYKSEDIFGFNVKKIKNKLPDELVESEKYEDYLKYLKNQTMNYM